jgi:hypothetical protein
MDAEGSKSKRFDLEDRTFDFANECKEFLKTIDRNIHNVEYYK